MRILSACAAICVVLSSPVWNQQPTAAPATNPAKLPAAPSKLTELFTAKVTAEWDAFKQKNKQAYSDLLADDFHAIEDDGEGMRKKSTAADEVDRSVIHDYRLFALTVIPVDANAAMVTYEVTQEFPPTVKVRFKRVFVSELWLKRDGQWKERFYQETRVR